MDCLGRSRITAIPNFVAIFHILQNSPASARSRSNRLWCFSSHPSNKKDFLFGNLLKWWAGVDSNHRTLAGTDLQSVAFSHSATYPYLILKLPLTGFEPVASPLPRECATPAPQRLKDLYQGSSATHLHSVNTQLTARSPCHKGSMICIK